MERTRARLSGSASGWLLLGALMFWSASEVAAVDFNLTWLWGAGPWEFNLTCNDTLTVSWTMGFHSFMELPAMNCSFPGKTIIPVGSSGVFIFPYTEPGSYYFKCGVGTHCITGGLHLTVNVFECGSTDFVHGAPVRSPPPGAVSSPIVAPSNLSPPLPTLDQLPGTVINWGFRNATSPGYDNLTVKCGDVVSWGWDTPVGSHALALVDHKGDVCGAQKVSRWGDPSARGAVSLLFAYPGAYNFICPVYTPVNHCTDGKMRMEVVVEECPEPGVVEWALQLKGEKYAPVRVQCGAQLTFRWSTGNRHTFLEVKEDDCTSEVLNPLWATPTTAGNVTVKFDADGERYFICAVASPMDHCSEGGMKVKVVTSGCSATSATEQAPAPVAEAPQPEDMAALPGKVLQWQWHGDDADDEVDRFPYDELDVDCGGIVSWNWTVPNDLHGLAAIESDDCSAPVIQQLVAPVSAANLSLYYTVSGPHYYKCPVVDEDSHCKDGRMKVQVNVGDCSAIGDVIPWLALDPTTKYAPITVHCGTTLTFRWSETSTRHDFQEIDKPVCFSNTVNAWWDAHTLEGEVNITFSSNGSRYFFCSWADHCEYGNQLVTVHTVGCVPSPPPPLAPSPPLPPPPPPRPAILPSSFPYHHINWTFPPNTSSGLPPLNIFCNTIVRFAWEGAPKHNVQQIADPSCGASTLESYGDPASVGAVSILFVHGGTYYYKCGVVPPVGRADHCAVGKMIQTINVARCLDHNIVPWGYRTEGANYVPFTVQCGQSITFQWDNPVGMHDVQRVEDFSCNSTVLRQIADTSKTGSVKVTLNQVGTYYYKCSVAIGGTSHCKDGNMLLQVDVEGKCPPRGRRLADVDVEDVEVMDGAAATA